MSLKNNILFNKNPLPIILVNIISGEIIDYNKSAQEFIAKTEEELININIYELFEKGEQENSRKIKELFKTNDYPQSFFYLNENNEKYQVELISSVIDKSEPEKVLIFFKKIQKIFHYNVIENRLNRMFVDNRVAIIELDSELKCKFCDKNISQVLNCKDGEFEFQNWLESLEIEDKENIVKKLNNLSEEKNSVRIIVRKKDKNKRRGIFSIKIDGIFINNILERIILVLTDLSHSEKILTELEEKNILIERIAEQSPNIIYVYDVESGRNIFINKDLKKVLAYTDLDKLPYESTEIVDSLIHPEDKSQFENYDLKTGNWSKEYIQKYQMRLKARNGTWKWFIGHEREFLRKNDKIINIVGILTDVTELKEAEERLTEAQKIAHLGYWELDLRTQKIFWSEEVYNIFGVENKNQEIDSEFFLSFIPKEEHKIFDKALNEHIFYGKEYKVLHSIILKNGEVKYLIERCKAEFDKNGDAIRCKGSVLDMTEQVKITEELKKLNKKLKESNKELNKAKEKAEQSNNLKTEFLHNLSHEIRTPMNAIIGFSELLNENDFEKEKIPFYSKLILNSSRQLLRIIDDIIEISKLETKQVSIKNKEISINDFLDNIFSIFDLKAKEKGIPLYLKKSINDSDAFIFIDDNKLNKIISNLIENAFKYTHKGYVEIGNRISGDKLEIYVRDTGDGIEKDKLEKIFERFHRVDDNINKTIDGIGLGLAIAKENVELLNGEILVKSQKLKGTIFIVVLPYNKIDKKMNEIEKDQLFTENNKILIAEDEEVNFIYFEAIVKKRFNNLQIFHAQDGQEAVKLCKENDFIIVFMDVKMPVMNGLDATSEILKFKPSLPIVGLTAYSSDEDRNIVLSAGCVDFLSKPIDKQKIFNLIQKYSKN